MLKSFSSSLILWGVLALAIGVVALAWPGITVLALVIMFAAYAFIAAGLQAAQAFSSRTAGPVFGHLLLGLVDVAAGVVALAWPVATALVLVLVVASWAVVAGAVQIVAAFRRGEAAGTRARSSSAASCRRPSVRCSSPAPTWARSPSPCCSACSI